MNQEKEIRPTANGTDQVLAGGSNTSIVTAQTRNTSEPASLVGSTVEKALDATLWRLKSGDIRLEELTPALMGFYTLGHADGIALMARELQQCAADRDRYYSAAFNPREPITIGKSYADLERVRAEIYSGGAE